MTKNYECMGCGSILSINSDHSQCLNCKPVNFDAREGAGPIISIIECKGSFALASSCGKCQGCIDEAKFIITANKSKSLCKNNVTMDELLMILSAQYILIDHMGFEKFQHFLSQEPN